MSAPGFLSRLWQRMLSIPAPIAPAATPLAPPMLPAMRQEQFPEVAGARERSQRQDVQLSSLYQRLVRTNNAYVTRNYGKGAVVEHDDATVAPLTAKERAQLSGPRSAVRFAAPPPPVLVTELVDVPKWLCDE